MSRRTMNEDLPAPPTEKEIAHALAMLADRDALHPKASKVYGFTAADIAHQIGVHPARRLGRGAVAGSWSGRMSPALRITSRLTSMWKRGLVYRDFDPDERHRWRYRLTAKAREQM